MTTSAPELRVAVIGFGLAGSTFHAPFIEITPGLRLSAIVTRDPERRERARQVHPSARLLSSADEILANPRDYDVVVIASPNATHVPLALATLDADLHVIVDKPFAGSSDEARQITGRAAARGLLVVPFQNRRWDGDFLTVRKLVSAGTLGEVYRFESRFERWRATPRARWCEPSAAANHEGIVYDIGPHLVDQAVALLGPVRDVYAELDRRHPDVRVDDDAFIALTHTSGVRSRIYASIAAAQSGPRFLVHGSKAAYVKYGLDPQEAALRSGAKAGASHWGEEPESAWGTVGIGGDAQRVRTEPGAYQRFYEGVERTLHEGAAPPVDARDAVAGLEIIEAAFASASKRTVISVEPQN